MPHVFPFIASLLSAADGSRARKEDIAKASFRRAVRQELTDASRSVERRALLSESRTSPAVMRRVLKSME
jgi:hypothetical protein